MIIILSLFEIFPSTFSFSWQKSRFKCTRPLNQHLKSLVHRESRSFAKLLTKATVKAHPASLNSCQYFSPPQKRTNTVKVSSDSRLKLTVSALLSNLQPRPTLWRRAMSDELWVAVPFADLKTALPLQIDARRGSERSSVAKLKHPTIRRLPNAKEDHWGNSRGFIERRNRNWSRYKLVVEEDC